MADSKDMKDGRAAAFVVGLMLLFFGCMFVFGVGVTLFYSGVVLIASAIFDGIKAKRKERKERKEADRQRNDPFKNEEWRQRTGPRYEPTDAPAPPRVKKD